ncbi:MAG TPA: DUF881 domain-containing protein [Clostridia bacterium]|nr:DUF881 domain-containing protein [Clostridia bacterium]
MEKSKMKIALTLGILCLILTFAISIQLKTMKEDNSVVSTSTANKELKEQAIIWKEKYEKSVKEYEKTEEELEKTRKQATQNDSTSMEKEKQIKENNIILGLTEVQGDGIIITLQDNTYKNNLDLTVENYLVHDTDIKTIVNELWNAGAGAISINGQRIVSTTSIVCDGNIIKINGEITGSPFEIKAIGKSLYSAIARPGGYFEFMGETGVKTAIKNQNNITIQKYNGGISTQYLKKVD